MNVSRFIQGLVITGIGLGVGIFMAFIMFSTGRLREWLDSFPGLSLAYEIIHLPAWGLFYVLDQLLPLYGDEGWILLPGAVVAQWVLVGLGVAVWWYLRGA